MLFPNTGIVSNLRPSVIKVHKVIIMSNKKYLGLCLLAMVGIIIVLVTISQKHGINQQNYQKIEIGMNEEQVVSILKVPAGDYETESVSFLHIEYFNKDGLLKEWKSNDGLVLLWFDHDGRVVNKDFIDFNPPCSEQTSIFSRYWKKTVEWFKN